MDSNPESPKAAPENTGKPEIFLLGANHLTASVDLRDRLLFTDQGMRDLVGTLKAAGTVDEAVILSTCNRSEIYGVSRTTSSAHEEAIRAWSRINGIGEQEILSHSYRFTGREAVNHLFRVMGSLDSLVLGETQILGQVKAAYQKSVENGWTDLHLNHLFQAGIHVGKRVHHETTIHEGAVSISYAAVMLAKKVLGELKDKTVGLVGTGEMGELAAQHLHKAGVSKFVIFNRSLTGAERLAADFGGEIVLLPELEKRLAACDIVISATGSPEVVITRRHVEAAMRHRGGHPLFLIDIAAPRDIDPACGEVDNTFLFSIDDLKAIVQENQELRRQASEKAQAIIDEEAAKVEAWHQSLALVPTIKTLRDRYRAMTEREIEKWAAGQSADGRAALEGLARGLMNKFLHAPTKGLKSLGEMGDGGRGGYYARLLFNLDDESQEDKQDDQSPA